MKIITNTAALFRPEDGKKLGINIIPVSISVLNRTFRDYLDIDPERLLDFLRKKETPVSSQPALGDVLDLLEDTDDETIMLTVADGLSGEYMTAMGVRNTLPNKEKIHIINSGSLGAPLHYMALKAAQMRDQGCPVNEIVARITSCVRSSLSFVIPADFQYLKRSGRINEITSRIGSALKLLPVLTQSEDRRRISVMTVRRTWKSAIGSVLERMQEAGVNEKYLVSVSYADKKELAQQVLRQIREVFPNSDNELVQLAPSLITHGGPGCIVVQAVEK